MAQLVMFKWTVGRQLEGKFLVAYLHQRGVGNSSPVPDSAQTIANNIKDVDRVVNYLTQKYRHKTVNIVGRSWGGMLAGSYAIASLLRYLQGRKTEEGAMLPLARARRANRGILRILNRRRADVDI